MGYVVSKRAKFAVIGSGSWATALVKILLEKEERIGWYIRSTETIDHIIENGTNPRYLRDVHFDIDRLSMSSDINEVVGVADVIVVAVPSAFLKATLQSLTVSLEGKFIISAVKGIVPDEYVTVAEYFNQKYGIEFDRIGIVTGPCHAEEVALERLSYLTVVCKELVNAATIADSISSKYIKTSLSTDIYGIEYSSVLKNIYAIAVGIAVGLGYGDNFLSVLISNSAMELDRFLEQTYPDQRNTHASAYLGDLLVTSYSQFSRNRTFGVMIGKGYSVKTAQIEMSMIAEGYYASECIAQINKRFEVDMPVANAVYAMLYQHAPIRATMKNLTTKLI